MSLAEQICDAVHAAVDQGALQAGAELPSSRELAERLGVSRNTVVSAYEELRALGVVESVRGSHTRVAGRGRLPKSKRLHELVKGSGYPSKARAIASPDGTPIVIFSPAQR